VYAWSIDLYLVDYSYDFAALFSLALSFLLFRLPKFTHRTTNKLPEKIQVSGQKSLFGLTKIDWVIKLLFVGVSL
jgi:hypothetical protein